MLSVTFPITRICPYIHDSHQTHYTELKPSAANKGVSLQEGSATLWLPL